mmetsp:Transcript_60772/g.144750  ORF Transcript_60772/g.144750 Transcript_60772/m.144750 type:complete len:220 (+) Transcript_60772:160-819(+)
MYTVTRTGHCQEEIWCGACKLSQIITNTLDQILQELAATKLPALRLRRIVRSIRGSGRAPEPARGCGSGGSWRTSSHHRMHLLVCSIHPSALRVRYATLLAVLRGPGTINLAYRIDLGHDLVGLLYCYLSWKLMVLVLCEHIIHGSHQIGVCHVLLVVFRAPTPAPAGPRRLLSGVSVCDVLCIRGATILLGRRWWRCTPTVLPVWLRRRLLLRLRRRR